MPKICCCWAAVKAVIDEARSDYGFGNLKIAANVPNPALVISVSGGEIDKSGLNAAI